MYRVLLVIELFFISMMWHISRNWVHRLLRGESIPEGTIALYIRFMRPEGWLHFSTLFVFLAYPGFHQPALALILPAVFFQQAFLFAVNDYFDRKVDALDTLKRKRNVVSSGRLSLAEGRGILIVLFLLGIIVPIFLGLEATLLSIVFLAGSYAYSAPPLRLKGRVFWDLISHAFLVFTYPFLFTTVTLGIYSLRNLVMYLIFLLLSLHIQISQEARDFDDDAVFETNSVMLLGYRKAYLFMSLVLGLGIVLSFWIVHAKLTSSLFLLVACMCANGLHDLYITWKSKDYGACFSNTWQRFLKKSLIAFAPVLLWWLFHR